MCFLPILFSEAFVDSFIFIQLNSIRESIKSRSDLNIWVGHFLLVNIK